MATNRTASLGAAAFSAALIATHPASAKDQFKWEGLYAGGHVSYSSAEGEWDLGGDGDGLLNLKGSAAGIGALTGYAFRVDDFILAIEGDINAENLKADNRFSITGEDIIGDDDPFFFGKSSVDRLNAMASLRVKAGLPGELPVIGEALLYGTAGVAFGRWTSSASTVVQIDSDPPVGLSIASGRHTDWRSALQFGAGVEVPMSDALSFKLEVIHTDYESERITLRGIIDDDIDSLTLGLDERVLSIRAGLVWRL